MTHHVITKISKFVMKSNKYKLIEQAVIISKRVLPPYSSKFSKKKSK